MNDMDRAVAPLLTALAQPRHMSSPAPWAGHTPFAMWFVTQLRPRLLVELGSYSGISYLAFCQAVEAAGLDTRCFAVDTWQGDEHAGYYGEHIYQTLRENHDPYYATFSTLLRKTFDEALADFADASVDLLHIDGLHTYEAVRHDFEVWLPKLSQRGVVLFHDTEVRGNDFGVWRFWDEIRQAYPGFSFQHSHGLGVLFVGRASLEPMLALGLDPSISDNLHNIKRAFQALGAAQERRAELHAVKHQSRETEMALQQAQEASSLTLAALHDERVVREDLDRRLHEERVVREDLDRRLHEERVAKEALDRRLHEELALQAQLRDSLQVETSINADLRHAATTQTRWIQRQDQVIAARDQALVQKESKIAALDATLQQTLDFRLKRGVRNSLRHLHPAVVSRRAVKVIHRSRNALRYALRGDFQALRERVNGLWRERQFSRMVAASACRHSGQVGILTTPHTLYVAHALQHALARVGLSCHILLDDAPSDFPHDFYIVLCAQMFTHLPPGERRIVFQMEQTVSDRWFDARYLSILENSRAVLDYSLANLTYLADRGIAYPHVFHVPLGAVVGYGPTHGIAPAQLPDENRPCVLFYGDPHVARRKDYLNALQAQYNVRIISNLFGSELQTAIASAQVVVNIHYYEGALLESTRIFECLSLGARVVSEAAADVGDYSGLDTVVQFVPVGDIAAMVQAVGRALDQSAPASSGQAEAHQAYLQATQDRFEFMFYRALLAQKLISYTQLQKVAVPPRGEAFALSLPETPQRRAAYLAAPAPGVQVFDGLRGRPGWIGCAMSYKYLCWSAWQQGVEQLLVCEDDVQLPADYDAVMQTIRIHLQANKEHWDIFVGIIAHLHSDTQVLDVYERDGLTFVTVDKMTSMVFNIYSSHAMEIISRWDETLEDDQTNTIDRYLERTENLRIVTLLEPVFGHREELTSSLWGFGNEQYNDYIAQSRAQLRDKVQAFRLQRPRAGGA